MEISIVTGTYNRIESLKRMIQSVWESLAGYGFHSFEIIIVDGGSTDGTIELCKGLPNVRLIEQGELLGAVKAFNAGAEVAKGKYVVLANDDITFLADSILRVYRFMESHPNIGIGCFYQDRDNLPYHVSRMQAIDPNGNICVVHYGQVCMVPRWLGDYVGWWGDYLHTYGGDNELSCQVWESGYGVVPVKGACIHDHKVVDILREINNGDSLPSNMHPDTIKWKKRWPNGPHIASQPDKFDKVSPKIAKRMRIMYFPLMERGNRMQIRTKVGLRDALHKRGVVLSYDYNNRGWGTAEAMAEQWEPDLFVFQLQNFDPKSYNIVMNLKKKFPMAKFVNWNGDYHPDNLYDSRYILLMNLFNLCGFVVDLNESYRDVNWFYWQIGYEISGAEPLDHTPKHDVVYLGNCYNSERLKLGDCLTNLKKSKVNVGMYGNWPDRMSDGFNLYDFDDGARLYRNAKIAVSTQQYPLAKGFVSNRLFQALSAGGCMVLQQEFPGMERLGLVDGEHYVVWKDYQDLTEKIHKYLEDDQTRERIAGVGQRFTIINHSFDKRVDELWSRLWT